jgi:SAM-dependent methyltransferase
MTPTDLASRLPRPLRDHLLFFEGLIEHDLQRFARSLPGNARVLDAGAGEARHAPLFGNQRYVAVDLAVGDTAWNYSHLHAVSDLCALPFRDGSFDAAINVVTLEHIRDPARALGEIGRTLKPGGRVFLAIPQDWEVHQAPHDYFRYTRYGIEHLLRQAGLEVLRIEAAGGYFRLLSRRLLNGIQFFKGGWRWLLFIPAAACLGPPAVLAPLLEPLDANKNFTLGYLCEAQRLPCPPPSA